VLAVRQMRSHLDDTAAAAVRRQVQAKENLMSVIITGHCHRRLCLLCSLEAHRVRSLSEPRATLAVTPGALLTKVEVRSMVNIHSTSKSMCPFCRNDDGVAHRVLTLASSTRGVRLTLVCGVCGHQWTEDIHGPASEQKPTIT
jgi:hypothetical protein